MLSVWNKEKENISKSLHVVKNDQNGMRARGMDGSIGKNGGKKIKIQAQKDGETLDIDNM